MINAITLDSYIYKAQNKLLVTTPQQKDVILSAVNTTTQSVSKSKIKRPNYSARIADIAICSVIVGGLLYKEKLDLKKISEHIDFKQAKTLEEAMEFGREHLKIPQYIGFEKEDFDVVNWVNEGICRICNKAKGKIYTPNAVAYKSILPDGDKTVYASMNARYGILSVNKDFVEKTRNEAKDKILDYVSKAIKKSKIQEEIPQEVKLTNNFKDALNTAGYNEKKTFSIISHEMGHLQHYNNVSKSFYYDLGKEEVIKDRKLSKKTKDLRELFESKIDTVGQVSSYAKASPLEFVAEIFAGLCEDVKFSDEILDLYQTLGGVMI